MARDLAYLLENSNPEIQKKLEYLGFKDQLTRTQFQASIRSFVKRRNKLAHHGLDSNYKLFQLDETTEKGKLLGKLDELKAIQDIWKKCIEDGEKIHPFNCDSWIFKEIK